MLKALTENPLAWLCLALLFAPSCATTSASGTMTVDGEEVEFSADVTSDGDDVDVDHTLVRQLDGRVTAQFELENDDNSPRRLHITWDWLDSDGIALRKGVGETPERFEVLPAGEIKTITIQAPTNYAIQIKIRVRSTRSAL